MEITKDMIIGDIVHQHPKAARIMLKYGLHCIGCHVSGHESLEDGCKGHGMDEETISKMVEEINAEINKVIETIEFTPHAVAMIKQFAKEDGKEGQPLRMKAQKSCCGIGYDMAFDEIKDDDNKFEFDGISIVIDPESYKLVKGSEVYFVDMPHESGFRIENPNIEPCAKGDNCCSKQDEEYQGGCC